ncbi:MAG TPA: hypothetical protein DCY95_06060, partial [Algoriphagus sp.]|nr:hypothetical protein [Algoriphagus sp.]
AGVLTPGTKKRNPPPALALLPCLKAKSQCQQERKRNTLEIKEIRLRRNIPKLEVIDKIFFKIREDMPSARYLSRRDFSSVAKK